VKALEAPPLPSPRTAWYVVVLLGLVYAVNIADRYVMSVLIEPIKADLHLSGTAIGFLTGVALAFFYVLAGVPVATLADRVNRTRLIAAALALWSLITALCGVTRTFGQLLLARIFVGVGEAGGTPPSASLISDYFDWRRRALALSVFSIGASLGSMLGAAAGYVSEHWGWRSTFFVLGIPGIVLALLVLLTVREPERGRLDAAPPGVSDPGIIAMLRYCASTPAMLHQFGASFLYCTWSWGLMWWTPSYLVRSLHFSLSDAGNSLALIHGIGGTAVLIGTGAIMRVIEKWDVRAVPRFIALACLVGTPASVVAFTSHDPTVVLAALWIFIPVTYAVFGPPYAMIQNLTPAPMRAQTMAMLQICGNIGNLIVAPQLVGLASDALSARYGSESLRIALIPLTFVGLWSALHWWLAGRYLERGMRRAGNLNTGVPLAEPA
jgi:predicted MFS family arabinose efflux permease